MKLADQTLIISLDYNFLLSRVESNHINQQLLYLLLCNGTAKTKSNEEVGIFLFEGTGLAN
jgi:hypothetical protein